MSDNWTEIIPLLSVVVLQPLKKNPLNSTSEPSDLLNFFLDILHLQCNVFLFHTLAFMELQRFFQTKLYFPSFHPLMIELTKDTEKTELLKVTQSFVETFRCVLCPVFHISFFQEPFKLPVCHKTQFLQRSPSPYRFHGAQSE